MEDAEHQRPAAIRRSEDRAEAGAPAYELVRRIGRRERTGGARLLFHACRDRFRLAGSSHRVQPARGLRQARAHRPDDGGADGTDDEHPAPPADAEGRCRHQHAAQKASRWNTHESERVGPGGVPSTRARRQELAQVRIDEWQFRADAQSGQEPGHHQHGGVHAEGAEQCEERIDGQVHQEHGPPAETIGEPAEQRGADEHANEGGAQDRREREAAQCELLRQHRAQNAREEDVEEIEECADAGNKRGPAVRGDRR